MNLTSNTLFVYDSLQPFLENGSNHRTARPSTTLFWSLLMERFIRPMAPGWFASVMGTAVTSLALTLASHAAADAGPALADPVALAASALHWLAIAMMSALGIAAVYRLIRHGDAVMEQLRHPVEGSFYATFPIAMLVMAAVWTIRGVSPALIAPLWWTGALGTFAVSYVVLFGLFTSERLKLGMVTPAHFIPAVGLVVIPVAGAPLAAASEGVLRELAFALNMTGFGAGVFMYVGLLALTMARHFLGAPVEGKMTPTLWVHLAPLSVIPLSMLALLKTTGDASLLRYGSLVAAAFLGAALWWLVLAVSMTIRNRRQGKLPFALSWWAFVFPIGACSVLAYRVSELLALEVLPLVASGLTLLALFVWSATALGTVRGIRTGAIFAPAH